MVIIKVENLIDFVADVFAHAESSPEEARRIATYLATANLTGHNPSGDSVLYLFDRKLD